MIETIAICLNHKLTLANIKMKTLLQDENQLITQFSMALLT